MKKKPKPKSKKQPAVSKPGVWSCTWRETTVASCCREARVLFARAGNPVGEKLMDEALRMLGAEDNTRQFEARFEFRYAEPPKKSGKAKKTQKKGRKG